MDNSLNIDQIVTQIEKLNYSDKVNIMSRIVDLLKKENRPGTEYSVTRLKGLGKDVWNETDLPNYIATERESWD